MKRLILTACIGFALLSCEKETIKPVEAAAYKMVLTDNDINTKYEVFHIKLNNSSAWLNVSNGFSKEWTQTTTILHDIKVVPLNANDSTKTHLYIYKNNSIIHHGYAYGVDSIITIKEIF